MEQQLKLPLPYGKNLYGCLRGNLDNPLIIFVHGFTGHKEEHIFYNGARFFEKQGISSFRFNLYSWQDDARIMENCTLSLHGLDLDVVIDYFRKRAVKKIFVAGHSFGGLTILLSQKQDFNAVILWDTSVDPANVAKSNYVKELDSYYNHFNSAFGFTIGNAMIKENTELKPLTFIRKLQKPVKVIVAGSGELIDGGKKYFQLANKPKDFSIIQNATHCFDEDGTEEKLFEETLKWIKKFL